MTHAASTEPLLGPQMSVNEWSELPEDVPGELVDGRLVEEEVPDYVHEVLVAWLARVLGNWADDSGAVVAASGAKFPVTPTHGRKPDLSVFLRGRRPPARGIVTVPPDIAIEVVSCSPRDVLRDREAKMLEYAEFGVRYYWLVDPGRRSFEIRALQSNGSYEAAVVQGEGRVESVPGCDGLAVDLDAMWSKRDELE